MRTTLQSINPADLLHVSNVRNMSIEDTDPVAMKELIESVKTFGILQPITARKVKGKLQIVYGHRRAVAAVAAQLPRVPVYVEDVPQEEIVARQLVENLQRADLKLAETAAGVRALYDEYQSARMVAEMLGKSAPWVSKMLSITAESAGIVARALVARDAITDLDLAHSLTIYEQRAGLKAAQILAPSIEAGEVSRAALRALIADLDRSKSAADQNDATDPEPANDVDAAATDGQESASEIRTLSFTAAELSCMRAALTAFHPEPNQLQTLLTIRAMIG